MFKFILPESNLIGICDLSKATSHRESLACYHKCLPHLWCGILSILVEFSDANLMSLQSPEQQLTLYLL